MERVRSLGGEVRPIDRKAPIWMAFVATIPGCTEIGDGFGKYADEAAADKSHRHPANCAVLCRLTNPACGKKAYR